MIGIVVSLATKPNSQDKFERAFAEQAAAVRANESGNRVYELLRSRARPDSYVLIEVYEDESALAAHRSGAHLAAHRPVTEAFIAANPKIEIFEVVPHSA